MKQDKEREKVPETCTVVGENADGTPATVRVNQLQLGEYAEAHKLFREGDEFARLTLSTGMPLRKVMALSPATFEEVVAADLRVNAYFFCYAGRAAQYRLMQERGLGALALYGLLPQRESARETAGDSPSESS